MNDEELRQVLRQIEDRIVAAQGEAVFAGLMVSSLFPLLLAKGLMTREEAERLIDSAMLVLEGHRATMNEGAQRVIDHARNRMEAQIAVLKVMPSHPGEDAPP